MSHLLQIENFTIHLDGEPIVREFSLSIDRGESVTILGNTGAGKSLLLHAVMGMLPQGLQLSGKAYLDDICLTDLDEKSIRQIWGRRITMLPQEPWHSLDPLMISRQQVSEVYECVCGETPQQADSIAIQKLERIGLTEAGQKLPGQLSGGMAQRLAFCATTAAGADVLLVDEPTKGLDISKRDYIVSLLKQRAENGCILVVTHDIEVARKLGGKIVVLQNGRVVEQGDAHIVLSSPASDYAKKLIGASPENWVKTPALQNKTGESYVFRVSLNFHQFPGHPN